MLQCTAVQCNAGGVCNNWARGFENVNRNVSQLIKAAAIFKAQEGHRFGRSRPKSGMPKRPQTVNGLKAEKPKTCPGAARKGVLHLQPRIMLPATVVLALVVVVHEGAQRIGIINGIRLIKKNQ